MRISKITLKNFRRHKSVSIPFEIDTTILIGENDAGKTSIIDAIRLMVSDAIPSVDDFGSVEDGLEIFLEFDTNKSYLLKASIEEGRIIHSKYIGYNARFVSQIKQNIDTNTPERNKEIARMFGISVGNSGPANIITKLRDLLDNRSNYSNGIFITQVNKFNDTLKIYFLDGKSFDDVSKFVHDTFFKDLQKSIWNEPIDPDDARTTLSQYIDDKVNSLKDRIETNIIEHDVVTKLKRYVKDITDIKLTTDYEKRDINLNVKVMFVVNGTERDARRFGDGTRRRVTFALLQHKIEHETEEALYILDEPDTHLHPRAQSELLDIMDDIAANGNQIIISTHSPFIMNSAYMRQIRLLEKQEAETRSRKLSDETARSSSMQTLGIENAHLFFSRKIVIVEGKTELNFFPLAYEKMYGRPITRDFIRLIPREGIQDAARFAEAVQSFLHHSDIFLVTDNDASEETLEIISSLQIPANNQYRLGMKEFEDLFAPHVIEEAWRVYAAGRGKRVGPEWTSENLFALSQQTHGATGANKFSEQLSRLNVGSGIGLTKPLLGEALGMYCLPYHLPTNVRDFLEHLGRD